MEGKNRMEQGNVLDDLHEECGVFGIYDFDGGNVASSVYHGLLALQHRGQESCGIAVGDTDGPRKVTTHKGMGLVNEVFTPEILEGYFYELDKLFADIREFEDGRDVMKELSGPVCHSGFNRLN